jgi:hypothetical protein
MSKPEGFETTEYNTKFEDPYEKYKVLRQIVEDRKYGSPSLPSEAFRVDFSGNEAKVFYTSYEMHLPVRMKEIEAQSEAALNEVVKYLKKEFKSRTKMKLDMKELKDRRNYSVQKVSLNERYMYSSWRFYELA